MHNGLERRNWELIYFLILCLANKTCYLLNTYKKIIKVKGKAIPVTDHEGP
jgi:hypothetical protein